LADLFVQLVFLRVGLLPHLLAAVKDDSASCTLRSLDKRLHTVALELDRFATAAK
jgi:hypothetical protein